MILKKQHLRWLDCSAQGYYVAKSFFRGKFLREVFLTVYDKKLQKSTWGYLFICEHNVLLAMMDDLTDPSGIYELEKSDGIASVGESTGDLTKILNATGEEFSFSIKTNHPISYIRLTDNYLLLCNIQAEANSGTFKGSFKEVFLVKPDYIERVQNLITLISSIIENKPVNVPEKLLGISSTVSLLNIVAVRIITLVIVPVSLIALLVILIASSNKMWVGVLFMIIVGIYYYFFQ
jgi:hypothetical protein